MLVGNRFGVGIPRCIVSPFILPVPMAAFTLGELGRYHKALWCFMDKQHTEVRLKGNGMANRMMRPPVRVML